MILVDSNIILDIITHDPVWYEWSSSQLKNVTNTSVLIINSIIYTEVSINFATIEEVEDVLSVHFFIREPLPAEACFLAGKVFMSYKKQSGNKSSPLADFFIGAHAAVKKYALLTRDTKRYKTYFPTVDLISPHQ